MKARQLIQDCAYGPETLKVLFKAFDDAWAEIEANFDAGSGGSDAARIKLATIVLSLAKHDSRDADQIKQSAVRIMGLQVPKPS
jgi:hypothetical protein